MSTLVPIQNTAPVAIVPAAPADTMAPETLREPSWVRWAGIAVALTLATLAGATGAWILVPFAIVIVALPALVHGTLDRLEAAAVTYTEEALTALEVTE